MSSSPPTSRPLRALAAGLLALSLTGCGSAEPEAPQRIFLVTIDTLRADHVEFLGYPAQTTPFLSRLAEESAVFTNAFSTASHTTPSHASLFTSLYPDQHGARANGQSFAPGVVTMASVLQKSGYRTAAFSSVNFLERLRPGFEVFSAHQRTASIYRPANLTIEKATRWLSRQKPEDKLFVWLHLFDVHEWENPSPIDRKRLSSYDVKSELSRAQLLDYAREHHGLQPDEEATEELLLNALESYDRRILFVDSQLKQFFEEQRALDGAGESLWIFTSDHGEGLFSHGYKGHGLELYREQLHVPLLVFSSKGLGAGRRIENLARHIDLLPTLAELTCSPLPPSQGLSLVPLLEGRAELDPARTAYAQRRPVVEEHKGWAQTPDELRTVYDLDYKYIFSSKEEDQFFDLRADPLEQSNLFEAPPSELERYQEVMGAYRRVFDSKEVTSSEVSEETKAELRSLGYVD